jgi:hypothetical protein
MQKVLFHVSFHFNTGRIATTSSYHGPIEIWRTITAPDSDHVIMLSVQHVDSEVDAYLQNENGNDDFFTAFELDVIQPAQRTSDHAHNINTDAVIK